MKEITKERVFFAVDVPSLWNSCRQVHGEYARIDFEILKDIYSSVINEESVSQYSVAYIITHRRATHGSFVEVLAAIGYVIKSSMIDYVVRDSKPISIHDDWTVGITVDAVSNLDHYDTFVIASGEAQYKHLLKYLTDKGKKTVVLTFESDEASKLYQDSTEILYLTKEIIYR